MLKWERIIAVGSLIVTVVSIIVTCMAMAQTARNTNDAVEPVNQIIILGDVIVADAEIVKSECL